LIGDFPDQREANHHPDVQFDSDVEGATAWQCLDMVRTRVAPLTYQAFDLYVLKGLSVDEGRSCWALRRGLCT